MSTKNKNLSNKKSSLDLIKKLSSVSMLGTEAEKEILNRNNDNIPLATNTENKQEKPVIKKVIEKEILEDPEPAIIKEKSLQEKKEVIYKEQETVVNILDGEVKKEYKDFFEKQKSDEKTTTVSINKDKHYTLQVITTIEAKGGIADLVDNIIQDFINRYQDDIKKSFKKMPIPKI